MFFRLFKESFLFAVNSLGVNKLRTFLSLFGITIGIFTIISVFTVLDWMEKAIRDSLATLGDNVVYVQKFPWSFDPNLEYWKIIKWPVVSMKDYEAIMKKSTKTEVASFSIVEPESMRYRKIQSDNAYIWATTHDFQDLRSFEIEEGRYFSPEESATGKNVAIVGYEVADRFFEGSSPVGKQITIAGHKTNVIGVFKKEGKGGISDSGMDEMTLVPINFARTFINMRNPFLGSNLMIRSKENVSIEELSEEVTMILRAARKLHPGEESNFSINRASLLTQAFDSIFVGINVGGWIIGGFAILVGGFGIANIMFVSVRERTNIIGIQKALGAKRFFILQQFLTESVLLSVIGGLLGVLMIFIATIVVNYLWELNMHLTLANILLAVLISGIIGIIAGYAPASSAAKMNPVDAIGYSFG
ncbi:MAG: ABC transporter permease [Bacteroidia bacterium]|nr:ABC transporter permease [Bacteroidia bacterium]